MGIVAPNIVNRQFDPDRPNQVWVTDITMIRTDEGWLYVCVVIDLFSRAVVGWSMQSRVHADLMLKALLMTVWRRKPAPGLLGSMGCLDRILLALQSFGGGPVCFGEQRVYLAIRPHAQPKKVTAIFRGHGGLVAGSDGFQIRKGPP